MPVSMILTITLIVSFLVFVNLLLLKFSCNKINTSNKTSQKTIVLNSQITNVQESEELAPTGS